MTTQKAYLPDCDMILVAREGDGSNLLDEDIKAGYVDYVYIEVHQFDQYGKVMDDVDGGQMLLTVPFSEAYPDGEEDRFIKDAVDFLYGDIKYVRL